MFKKLLSVLTIAGAMLAGSASVKADDMSSPDLAATVLSDVHHTNLMEIQMGKLAEKNGSSDAVKTFGDTLVKDHSDADKKVKDLAASQNIKLRDMKMPKGQENATMAKLKTLQGKDFDLEFAQAMEKGHAESIQKLQSAQPKLAGTPTGDLVNNILPVIEKHEKTASGIVASLKS